jgi:hypothetical protein
VRRGVVLLIVVGCLLVPLADLGVWVRRVVLDTDEFTALADDLLARKAVRDGLAAEIVEQLEQAQPAIGRIRVSLRPLVSEALATPAFGELFAEEIAGVHDQLVDGADQLSLDLDPALVLVTEQVRRVAPEVAAVIPSGAALGDIVLVRRSQAPYLWAGVEAARWGSLAAIVVAFGLLALGVALARRWPLALGVAGVGVLVGSLLFLALVAAAEAYVTRWVGVAVDRAAFRASWDVFERSLMVQTLLVALVGVAAAAAGFLIELGSTRSVSR